MKPTNFLSGPADSQPGGINNPGTGINVSVPQGTSPNILQSILSNLPNILGIFGPQQPIQQKPDYTPYYILGGAAIVYLIASRK